MIRQPLSQASRRRKFLVATHPGSSNSSFTWLGSDNHGTGIVLSFYTQKVFGSAFSLWSQAQQSGDKKKSLFPAGLEPATLCVWSTRDNHYTTETSLIHTTYSQRLSLSNHGPVAQWITRLPTEQKIAGSSPAWIDKSFCHLPFSTLLTCFIWQNAKNI